MLSASSGATPLPLSSTRSMIASAFAATRMITRPRASDRSAAASIALATRLIRTCSIWTPSAFYRRDETDAFNLHLNAARGCFLPTKRADPLRKGGHIDRRQVQVAI